MNFRLYLIIIFFSLFGVVSFFLSWPEYQKLLMVQAEIGKTQEEIQTADKRLEELNSVSEKLKGYESQLKILDTALPDKFYMPHLYDFFEKVCPQYGLILDGMNASVGEVNDFGVKEVKISLSLSGDYESFKEFLLALENSVRFFSLESMNLIAPEKENTPFKFSLDLSTYIR